LPEERAVAITEDDVTWLRARLAEATEAAADDDLRAARVQMASDFFGVWNLRRVLKDEAQPSAAAIAAYMERLDALAAQQTDALVVRSLQEEFMAAIPEARAYDGPQMVRTDPDAEIDTSE